MTLHESLPLQVLSPLLTPTSRSQFKAELQSETQAVTLVSAAGQGACSRHSPSLSLARFLCRIDLDHHPPASDFPLVTAVCTASESIHENVKFSSRHYCPSPSPPSAVVHPQQLMRHQAFLSAEMFRNSTKRIPVSMPPPLAVKIPTKRPVLPQIYVTDTFLHISNSIFRIHSLRSSRLSVILSRQALIRFPRNLIPGDLLKFFDIS